MPGGVYWKGYLKLSLVTCPVTLVPATTEGERMRFRTLNRDSGNPVHARWIDSGSGKPVADEDVGRGYPRGNDGFVLIEDEELEAVQLESARTIDIETFVPAAQIDPIWLDKPYFLTPSDKVGAEAYAVIRAAMAATGTLGVARLVLARRERAVALQPRDQGVLLWSLRFGDEVRDPDEAFAEAPSDKPDPKLSKLIRSLIRERTGPWDPAFLCDPVQERLEELVKARRKGRKPRRKAPPRGKAPGEVIDIMEALRRSIAADKP